jgi:hypothetical protein
VKVATAAPGEAAGGVVDGRSVGDLLLDADVTAREILWDPNPGTAKAKVRTWGEVVEAAAELWSAIPDRARDPSMARIHELTVGLHRTQQRTRWPGHGEPDPHLERVADNLMRATELVSGRRHPTAPLSEPGHLDSQAARTRIMHVLYVSAHGVGAAGRQHARDLQRILDSKHRLAPGESVSQARDLTARIRTIERLAGSYLQDRWPAGLLGQHRDPVEPARLEEALARWDVQARRSLAGPPSAANVLYTTMIERDLTLGSAVITAAAAGRGLSGAQEHAERVRPALNELEVAWGRLGHDLGQLTGRQRRVDVELLHAGSEARAALREITHDLGGLARSDTMAGRVDLRATSLELQRGLVAAVDLAHVVRDVVGDPQLTVPARGARAKCAGSGTDEGLGAWVDAGDLCHDRVVPLPQAARDVLIDHAGQVIAAAATLDSASAFLGGGPSPTLAEPSLPGRTHEDRAVPGPVMTRPGYGCER